MFLYFVPMDGVEYFSGIWGWEGMFLCFYVSRKQDCVHGLMAYMAYGLQVNDR